MKRLGIAVVLMFMGSIAAAQASVPVAAITIGQRWIKFSDPQEGAFQVDVPQGWKVAGGTTRRNALQYRSWVNTIYTVANNHKFYWVNPSGTVVGTETDTPPKGFSRLNRMPP